MTRTRSTRLRSVRALSVALTALVVVLGVAPAQAASKASTQVRGWSTSSTNATAGGTIRVALKVTSGRRASAGRTVLLQRYAGGRWVGAAKARSTRYGNAVLRMRTGAAGTTHRLRVHVKSTRTRRAVTTGVKRVSVVAPVAATAGQREMLSLVNRARATSRKCGATTYPAVPPLALNARLIAAAQGHATDMANANYFDHEGRDGSSVADRVTAEGYAWRAVGENIAAGQRTTQAVMTAWLASPGHCRNLMSADYTELGVGDATNADSRYKIYWVQNFAAPR